MEILTNANVVFCVVVAVLTIINFILLIVNNRRVKKYKAYYEKALAKFNSKQNIQDDFESIYDRLKEVENISQQTVDTVNSYRDKMKSNVQKIGFVKYNAYDETENKLSFALALLDEYNTGVLINHIYSKHGSNMYAKLVLDGNVEDRISEEEATALRIAMEDKEFKLRKAENIKKVKGKNKKN